MSIPNELVCILDDDHSVRSSLENLLHSDGLPARTFATPDEFLAYTRVHRVAVAVLDVVMPTTSGLEVQERLRDTSPATRVIVMTGRDEPGVRASAMEQGAIGFFVKPFDDEAFLSVVRKAVCRAT